MREQIDQIVNALCEAPAETRRQHPLYQAIAEAVQDSPDDYNDLVMFARNPERYESLLRDLLKLRLPQNQALLSKLKSLLDTASEQQRSHDLDIGGNATVGAAFAGDVGSVNIAKQTFEAAVQVFFGERRDTDENDRELLAHYLNSLIQDFSLARRPDAITKNQQYSPIAPQSLRTMYLTMASETWVRVEDDSAQQEVDADEALPDRARRLVPIKGNAQAQGTGALDMPSSKCELRQPYLLTRAVSDSRRLVLLGRAGSGKTTFLRYLAVALAQAGQAASGTQPDLPGWKAGLLIPFYASLGGFAAKLRENANQPTWSDLWRYLVQIGDAGLWQGLKDPLTASFRDGKLLLLLDGLEEIANPQVRADVAEAIVELAGKSNSYVVVACRDQAFDEEVPDAFKTWGQPARIARLTLGQVRYFVHEWYRGVAADDKIKDTDVDEQSTDLISQLKDWPNWQDLIQGPKFLDHVCTLHATKRWVPENRAALYRDNIQRMRDQWEKRTQPNQPKSLLVQLKEDRTLGNLRVEDIQRTLAKLAYRARKNAPTVGQRGSIERGIVREEFLTLFQQFGLDIGQAAVKSEIVLDFIESDALLDQVRPGVYQFNDYESYLAACYLIDQRGERPDTLVLSYTNWRENANKWRDVILLALQVLLLEEDDDTVAQWLQLLVAQEHGARARYKEERARATIFAAECLEKLGAKPVVQVGDAKDAPKPWDGMEQVLPNVTTMSLRELWSDLAQALIDVVGSESAASADRVQAGVYLCKLGDPRPGVRTPMPDLVQISGGSFVPGSSPAEAIELHDSNEAWMARQQTQISFPLDWASDQLNDRPVEVPTFSVARYPVTNAQYALFIERGGYDPKQPWWDAAGRAWLERDDSTITSESDPLFARYRQRTTKRAPEYWQHPLLGHQQTNFPVVGICWYEALAYCRWLSHDRAANQRGQIIRLPSEVEWEFAARGTDRRRFPWGSAEPDGELANFFKLFDGTTSVGCFPAGATPTNIYDMAGNVYEWTGSLYRSYPYDPFDGFDGAADPVKHGVVMRGGGWRDPLAALFAASRNFFINRGAPPDCFFDKLGFRIASSNS